MNNFILVLQSSVKPIEKREGGGSRNWGNVKDEVDAR